MGYNIVFNGIKYGEKGFAKLLNDNVNINGMAVHDAISNQLKWTVNNCSNINSLFLWNALDYLWYELIGVHSKQTDAETQRLITDFVEKNLVKEDW